MDESLTEVEKLAKEAFRHIDSDMLTEAIDCLDKIIELERFNPHEWVWTTKGSLISSLAVNVRESGLRVRHYRPEITDDQKHLLKDALKCFKKAIDINPKSDSAFQSQALTLSRLGIMDQAIESNNIAVELNPNNYAAWMQGTACLVNLGRFKEAYECCKRAKQVSGLGTLDHNSKLEFFLNFATVLVGLKRYEEALVEINRVIDLDDKSALAWAKKGSILFYLHRTGYLECFDKAIALEPDRELWKELRSDPNKPR